MTRLNHYGPTIHCIVVHFAECSLQMLVIGVQQDQDKSGNIMYSWDINGCPHANTKGLVNQFEQMKPLIDVVTLIGRPLIQKHQVMNPSLTDV